MKTAVAELRRDLTQLRAATGADSVRPIGYRLFDPAGQIVDETGGDDAFQLDFITDMAPVLFGNKRYGVISSGRSAGKSHGATRWILHMSLVEACRILVARETLLSLELSMYSLLGDVIRASDYLSTVFEIQSSKIICLATGSEIFFRGLRRDRVESSIKSIERIKYCVVEESQTLGVVSLDILRPSIRDEGSRIIFLINPRLSSDPVYSQFVAENRTDTDLVRLTYKDNPWCPDVMESEAEADYARNPKHAGHVWGGELRDISEHAVFNNWIVENFDLDEVIHEIQQSVIVPRTLSARQRRDKLHYERSKIESQFYCGLDHGWVHPTAGIEIFHDYVGKRIFVMRELYETKLPLDRIGTELKTSIPRIADGWPVSVDSARPDVIDFLRRSSINARPCTKVRIAERIDVLQTYLIVVHPSCTNTISELSNYSWKTDSNGTVLPEPEDRWNHLLDGLSYALGDQLRYNVGRYQRMGNPFV